VFTEHRCRTHQVVLVGRDLRIRVRIDYHCKGH
jgi:hypothetical protein